MRISLSRARRLFFAPLLLAAVIMFGEPAVAAPAAIESAPVTGTVTTIDGTPVNRALVTFVRNGITRSASTDPQGRYSIAVAPGTYVFDVYAKGYESPGAREVSAVTGQTTIIDVQLARSTSSLTTIGRVVTRAGDALQTSSAPTQQLDVRTYAARGGGDLASLLADEADIAVVVRPTGGNPAAPAAVSLRGPDPTETLVDLDGHAINSGGSGAFDLSLIDPAQLESVQVVDGISPGSLAGPNTIGGTINVQTLDPTSTSHALMRLSMGSFGAFGATAQATGSDSGVGYAISLHRQTTRGDPDAAVLSTDGDNIFVGSGVNGSTALAKVRFGIDGGAGSVLVTASGQSAFHDLSASLSAIETPALIPAQATHVDFSGSAQLTHDGAYGLDVQLPLGHADQAGAAPATLTIRHLTSLFDQSVVGPAAGTDPFLLDERDLIGDDVVQIDRPFSSGLLTIKADLRTESLRTVPTPGGAQDQIVVGPLAAAGAAGPSPVVLGQTQRSLGIRYAVDASSKIHVEAAAYASDFSTFGASTDPRVGVVWTPDAQTSIRASFGTTFQSPQLLELYVPASLPPPDPDGFFDIGNPHLTADRATDIGLGFEHLFGGARSARVGIDVFRTSLRDSSHRFIPSVDCNPSGGPPPPPNECESFPINVGDSVYEGLESHASWLIGGSTRARVAYAVDAAAPTTVSPLFQDGSIVAGEQYLGVPLQTATFDLEHDSDGALSEDALVRYEGRYNELNRPPFAQLQAGLTWRRGAFEAGLYGTNLTGVYDAGYTLAGQGVPYGGLAGPIPTDAFSLQGPAVTFVMTLRR
ncbi:MAG TPA: TonB-dependent receptor [Candidatus Eremiobacteraceae bacterium]|nr:TonB-dependent receptor [Candidatus Eremiobacteraceae bacterium]